MIGGLVQIKLSFLARRVFLAAVLAVLFPLVNVTLAQTNSNSENGEQAVTPRVNLALQAAFARGGTALYITPEMGVNPSAGADIVSAAQAVAKGSDANCIPANFGVLPGTPAARNIFGFSTQGNVLASAPIPAGPTNTDTDYSPLWQVSLVSWNSGRRARALTSQADILKAASDGEVSITKTDITVECSVVFTPQGGLLPGVRIVGYDGQYDATNAAKY